MVIVVMVAMFGVRNLQAGFSLRLFAIGRVRSSATRRTLLEEVRHKVHLQRRGEELSFVHSGDIFPTAIAVKACKGYRGGKGRAGNCDYIRLDRFVHSC